MSSAGNLAAWLLEGAQSSGAGARAAMRQGDRHLTYDELGAQVGKLSAALRGLSLARGDRVLVLMQDTIEAAIAILGVIHAGGVAVPVSELATTDDVQEYVAHAGAVMAIVDESHEAVVDAVKTESPDLQHVVCVHAKLPGTHDFDAIVAAASPAAPVPIACRANEPSIPRSRSSSSRSWSTRLPKAPSGSTSRSSTVTGSWPTRTASTSTCSRAA